MAWDQSKYEEDLNNRLIAMGIDPNQKAINTGPDYGPSSQEQGMGGLGSIAGNLAGKWAGKKGAQWVGGKLGFGSGGGLQEASLLGEGGAPIMQSTGPAATNDLFGAGSGFGSGTGVMNTPSSMMGGYTPMQGLGAAGAALGAYQSYKGIKGKDPLGAGMGAAGLGLGLNAMGLALGPMGWAAMAALPAIAGIRKLTGSKDRWKDEQAGVDKLAKKGVVGWDQYAAATPRITERRSVPELIKLEQSKIDGGQYGNVDFAKTRDVEYLKPEDTWGYSVWGNKFGDDYFGKFSEDQRKNINQMALDAGAVKEGRGQIKIDWSKNGLENKIQEYLAGAK